MEIKRAEYAYGFALPSQYRPNGMPEIAVAGRSNVGKSSLINMLTRNSKLAKIGKTPGKTRIINAFIINQSFVLWICPDTVCKNCENEKQRFSELIEYYLNNSEQLRHVFLLLDIQA